MNLQNVSHDYRSLMKRTVEEQLNNELVQDYGFPRAICRSLVEVFFGYFNLYLGADRTAGQLVYRAVPYDCPPGIVRALNNRKYKSPQRHREGRLVPEIARMTKHSEEAVNWYIKAFNKVRMLKDRLGIDDMARTLEMSQYLIKEYLNIMEQVQGSEMNA